MVYINVRALRFPQVNLARSIEYRIAKTMPTENDLAIARILIELQVARAMLTTLADALSDHIKRGPDHLTLDYLADVENRLTASFESQVLRGTDMSNEGGRQIATKMREVFEEQLDEFLFRLKVGFPKHQHPRDDPDWDQ